MVARGLIAAGLLSLAAITAGRVPVWTDDRLLWSAAVSVTPDRPRALLNLAAAELGRDDVPIAAALARIAHARIALTDPRRSHRRGEWLLIADYNEARGLMALQQTDRAKALLAGILQREPSWLPAVRMARWVE